MLIFYADECGDHSMNTAATNPAVLKSGTSEFFILSAVGVRDTSRRPIAEALFDIKRKHFGESVHDEPWSTPISAHGTEKSFSSPISSRIRPRSA